MASSQLDLIELLRAIDPDAPIAERHLWLIQLLDWVRGDLQSAELSVARVRMLIDAAEVRPDCLRQWHRWWERFLTTVDATPLLADLGFAAQGSFIGELDRRLRRKLLPPTPDTRNLAELFALLFPTEFDARWLRLLDPRTLRRMRVVMFRAQAPVDSRVPDYALRSLMDAVSYAVSQISAVGQSAEMRLRMSPEAVAERPFTELPGAAEGLRTAVLRAGRQSPEAAAAATRLREQLDACRAAAFTVYSHLQEHGISVNLEFQLRQLRQRILRVKALLLCVETEAPAQATAQLLSHLVKVDVDSRSLGDLWSSSTQLLAAKVTERNAETGQHYITRTAAEYRAMLGKAAGGGALLAFTTWIKLAIGALGLSAFWGGMAAGVNYALSFVLIMLLHWTVATKQPAMTAPAMAARLKDVTTPEGVQDFVDEVVCLLRSQFAAIVGNVGLVIPGVLAIAWLLQAAGVAHPIGASHARHILAQHHLLGPTVLFAAATGGLLFASSIVAGWVENWFAFNRIDSVMAYSPAFTRRLGAERAARWGRYWRANISGYAANISLGLMLGLVPPILGFFGIPFEVRHVTLVAGQLAAAVFELGPGVLHQPALGWALGGMLATGLMNVATSFVLAFRLALTAQNVPVVDRRRVYAALARQLARRPLSVLLPLGGLRPGGTAASMPGRDKDTPH